jgi:hypothetical protein
MVPRARRRDHRRMSTADCEARDLPPLDAPARASWAERELALSFDLLPEYGIQIPTGEGDEGGALLAT